MLQSSTKKASLHRTKAAVGGAGGWTGGTGRVNQVPGRVGWGTDESIINFNGNIQRVEK